MDTNLILDTDSYKASHYLQYPPGTTGIYSYLESRGGKYNSTVFFGLQYILKCFEKGITVNDVEEANAVFKAHGEPFPYEDFKYIATELKGKLPLKIRAVPEGTVVPTHNALMTVESTDPRAFWAVTYFETQLMRVWYPTTVATQSWHIRKLIQAYLERTADDPNNEILFKLHDFGSRGVSSQESAAIGGMSHLVNFRGTDTVTALMAARRVYGEDMAGYSIPAAEHSTITSWGRAGEADAYANMLKNFAKPGSLVAVVSDSYDLWNAIEKIWGDTLRQRVIDSGATVVIRPDSGNPAEVVLRALKLLESKFGTSYNSKAFKVLNNVRVIQGDGINEESIREILELAAQNGYSATNVAFGMGGALLQQVNRDTQRFAYKASEVTINRVRVPINKDPITDPGKASKAGRVDLIKRNGKFEAVIGDAIGSELRTVFENGKVMNLHTLADIRARAWPSNI